MREYGSGRPLVFSHIPKTAGTSLRAALAEALQPTVFVEGFDASLFGGYDDYDTISPAARSTIYLAPEEIPADATLVAGHISPWTTMQRFPGADHITVLRVPQVRVISQFLHGRAVSELQVRLWGVAAEAFRVGWLPMREHLEHPMVAPNTDNTITRFLVWPHPLLKKTEFLDERHDDELYELALARLDQMAHVNLAENPGFMDDLSAWLGRSLPSTRLNERASVPPRRRPDLAAELTPETRALLDHRVRIDSRVWEHVARRVLPGEDPAAVRSTAIDGAIERYSDMLEQGDTRSLKRRGAEWLYDLAVRLRRRRPAPTPDRDPVS
jgi:hypothetical protein